MAAKNNLSEQAFSEAAPKGRRVASLSAKPQKRSTSPQESASCFDVVLAAGQKIPQRELAKIPTDSATQHDHYLYGAAKRRA